MPSEICLALEGGWKRKLRVVCCDYCSVLDAKQVVAADHWWWSKGSRKASTMKNKYMCQNNTCTRFRFCVNSFAWVGVNIMSVVCGALVGSDRTTPKSALFTSHVNHSKLQQSNSSPQKGQSWINQQMSVNKESISCNSTHPQFWNLIQIDIKALETCLFNQEKTPNPNQIISLNQS